MRTPNRLTVKVFSAGNTPLAEMPLGLDKLIMARWSTGYPGGLFLDGFLELESKTYHQWLLQGARRVVIYSGAQVAYEGYIDGVDIAYGGAYHGIGLRLSGAWGLFMVRKRLNKVWADDRISEDVWVVNESRGSTPRATFDRYNRIRITPKNETWPLNSIAGIAYTMPSGQTIKRVSLNYDAQFSTYSFEFRLRDTANSVNIWSVTASGTGSRDDTLATPVQSLELQLVATVGGQTPPADGSVYGQISNVMVYSETGAINLTEIVKDIRDSFSEISGFGQHIQSNTLEIAPFYTDGWQTLAETVEAAAAFGDDSDNAWAVGLTSSEDAAARDGRPAFYCERIPTLNDYEYIITPNDDNLTSELVVSVDYSQIYNYIIVRYRDALGRTRFLTPANDATLTDSDSVSRYGERMIELNLPTASATTAARVGRRFLQQYKNPLLHFPTVNVRGYIRTKKGGSISPALVRAGQRVKFAGMIIAPPSVLQKTDAIQIIRHTTYNSLDETLAIEVGTIDNFATFLAKISAGIKPD